jgi:hypothetical protein
MKHIATILCLFLSFIANAQNWNQIIKKVALDRSVSLFGSSVCVSGDVAIVGAILEGEKNIFDQSKNFQSAGAAYIFRLVNGIWTQEQKLEASDKKAESQFGWSVSISGDYAVVGAQYVEGAYIFRRKNGTWKQLPKLECPDKANFDFFGRSVAISGDYLIVGAPNKYYGNITGAGAAYIFKRTNDSTWNQPQKLIPINFNSSDLFGYSVAISGETVVIGANFDSEDVLDQNTISLSGSAYIFKLYNGNWIQEQKLVASNRTVQAEFGCSVSISGDNVIVGSWGDQLDARGKNTKEGAGAAYVFNRTNNAWTLVNKLAASDRFDGDAFGWSVAISGDYAIIGAREEDEDDFFEDIKSGAGSAYIFKLSNGTWSQLQKIVASDRAVNDQFGNAVSISSNYAFVGAPNEDEDATGNNTMQGAGSTYMFQLNPVVTSTTDEELNQGAINIFPNPTARNLTVKSSSLYDSYSVSNQTGNEIISGKIEGENINFEQLKAGVYFLKLHSLTGENIVKKFVKQ